MVEEGSRNFQLCGHGREGLPRKVLFGQISEGSKGCKPEDSLV